MSSAEIINFLESIVNRILQAVGDLENRIVMVEQRLEELERMSGGSGAYGAPSPGRGAPSQAAPPMIQDSRRAPSPMMPPPAPPQPQAYANPQQQWRAPRQDSYPQPPAPGYQSRPPAPSYPPQGQQQQPQGYAPQGYAPQGQPPQQQGPPGPRPSASPLNVRQEMTGELKDIFARMRARAEGRQ